MIEYTVKVFDDGTKQWFLNGELHREDGPAIECSSGTKQWWLNGQLHREDGPAVECFDGTKQWVLNGKLHREDGPAVEWPSGTKEWWLNGERYSGQEVLKRTQPAKELSIEEIEALLGYKIKVVK